jgi:hypothetical protein
MAMLLKTTYLQHQPKTGKVRQAECTTTWPWGKQQHDHGVIFDFDLLKGKLTYFAC